MRSFQVCFLKSIPFHVETVHWTVEPRDRTCRTWFAFCFFARNKFNTKYGEYFERKNLALRNAIWRQVGLTAHVDTNVPFGQTSTDKKPAETDLLTEYWRTLLR